MMIFLGKSAELIMAVGSGLIMDRVEVTICLSYD